MGYVDNSETSIAEAWDALSRATNRGGRRAIPAEAMREHPTLLGQIAKGVAIGVVRRSERDEEWKPWDGFDQLCRIPRGVNYAEFSDKAWEHPDHDGRLDCATVVGAVLMSRQSYI